jgi:transcription elongation factor Elf1
MVNNDSPETYTCPYCGNHLSKINPLNAPYCHNMMECRHCFRYLTLTQVLGRKSKGTVDHYEVLK